jgi:hypothetical protein
MKGAYVMERQSTMIKKPGVRFEIRSEQPMGRFKRGWMTGLGIGLLIVLTNLAAQAQDVESRIEKLESSMSNMIESLPPWVQRFQFKGDLRLRYQYDNTTEQPERHRGRLRYRLGVTAHVTDQIKAVFGLASGGDDPRSTNQTFQDSFSSKGVRLDLAYAAYTPFKGVKLLGGKFNNPLWLPSDLLWDSDINPEGGALQIDVKAVPNLNIFLMTGVFVIDDNSQGADPLVIPIQGGLAYKFTEQVDIKLAVTYYNFTDVQGTALKFPGRFAGVGNTLVDDVLRFDYDSISVGAELGFDKPLGEIIPYVGLIAEYVHNLDPDTDNNGYLGGVVIGYRKVSQGGQWQGRVQYRRLERDAWLDVFPDSDFLSGATNGKGVELIVNYGVFKNVTVGMDYYHSKQIDGDAGQDIFQFDVLLKF